MDLANYYTNLITLGVPQSEAYSLYDFARRSGGTRVRPGAGPNANVAALAAYLTPSADVLQARQLVQQVELQRRTQQQAMAQAAENAQAQAQRQARLQRQQQAQHEDVAEDLGADDDDDNQLEIYEQYKPSKVSEGLPHPDPIVETASLASVTPPDIKYEHSLQDTVARGLLSNAQLETVLYANMRFNVRLEDGARAGFFLGDGAGVGKGRQIAAVVKEFWAKGGRRVLWVSTSNDLRYDGRRDMDDVDASKIPIMPEKSASVPQGDLHKHYPKGGVLFITYSLLVSKGGAKVAGGAAKRARSNTTSRGRAGRAAPGRRGGASSTMAMVGENGEPEADPRGKAELAAALLARGTRLQQVVSWLKGPDGKGECLIVLDECHKAKNLLDAGGNSSQTGVAVEALQKELPNARVLYSSATGASEPSNLRYMVRLGTFGYKDIGEFITVLSKSGLGALEMFCMGLKSTGTYLSRTLAYTGAEFRMEQMDLDPIFKVMYDRSCRLWQLLWCIMRQLPKSSSKQGGRDIKGAQFWSSHQRFYRQMLMASKVQRCAQLAHEALTDGMAVVIGLQSTGEANTNAAKEMSGEDMNDFVSAPKMVLHRFISTWLFHFKSPVQMDKRRLRRLLKQVYDAIKEWKALKSCEEEADWQAKLAKQAAMAARAAENRRLANRAVAAADAAAAAAAAAGAGAGPSASGEAAAAAEDEAAAGGSQPQSQKAAEQEEEFDEEVLLAVERTLDEAMAERRRRAKLMGDFIDLAADGGEAEDKETEQALAEMEREEVQEAARAEERKRQEKLARLEAALAAATAAAEDARAEFAALEAEAAAPPGADGAATAAPVAATGRRTPAASGDVAAAGTAAGAGAVDLLEDDVDGDKENEARGNGATNAAAGPSTARPKGPAGHAAARRRGARIDDSGDEEEDGDAQRPKGTRAARGGSAANRSSSDGSGVVGARKPVRGNAKRAALISDDDDDGEDEDGGLAGASSPPPRAAAPANASGRPQRAAAAAATAALAGKPPKGPSAPAAPAPAAAKGRGKAAVKVKAEAAAGPSVSGRSGSGAPSASKPKAAAGAGADRKAAPQREEVDLLSDDDDEGEEAPKAAAGKGKAGQSAKPQPSPAPEAEEDAEEGEEDEGEGYEDTFCEVCGKDEHDSNIIILCDGCDKGFHQACLTPPLKALPKGDWFCAACAKARAAKAGAGAKPAGATRGRKRRSPESASSSADERSEASEDDDDVIDVEDEDTGRAAKRAKVPATAAAAAAANGRGTRAAAATGKRPLATAAKGRKQARSGDDDDEDESSASDDDLEDSASELVSESDSDDDFVATATHGRPRLRSAGAGAAARKSATAADLVAVSQLTDDRKLRMKMLAAKTRLREAEQAAARAQADLDQFTALATGRTRGGGAYGAAGGRRGSEAGGASAASGGGASPEESSDGAVQEAAGGGAAGAAGARRGGAVPSNPALYRHAVKPPPARPSGRGRAAGGKGKGEKGKGGGGKRRRRGAAGSDDDNAEESDYDASGASDDDDDGAADSDDVLLAGAGLESEGGSEDDGDGSIMDELVDEDVAGYGRTGGHSGAQGVAIPEELRRCRRLLLRLLDAQELPANPLDQLTELLGGPDAVAEMTGRKGGLVRLGDGNVRYQVRREEDPAKMVNLREKEDFMQGRKRVAIISEAASTGISLQADRRVANQRRRFHITLELPWSADKAIQQFGRSHRSNQASAPIYCLLVTKCGGEYRFAGAVAKRLQSLGALLRGDRRALGASANLKPFDVDNKYGDQALVKMYECLQGCQNTMAGVKVPLLAEDAYSAAARATAADSYEREREALTHLQDCMLQMAIFKKEGGVVVLDQRASAKGGASASGGVPRFLNRLLGLQLADQDALFAYFSAIMDALVKQARTSGTYDEGLLNLALSQVEVAHEADVHVDAASGAVTRYLALDVDDGMPFEDAQAKLDEALEDMRGENAPKKFMDMVGFYVLRRNDNVGSSGHPLVLLATMIRKTDTGSKSHAFRIMRPNQVKPFVFKQHELEEKYKKVDVKVGEAHWRFWYDFLHSNCLHGRECIRRKRKEACSFGSRFYRMHLISGAVLPVMRKLMDVVQGSNYGRTSTGSKAMPRVARATLPDGRIVVGLNLLEADADAFMHAVQA